MTAIASSDVIVIGSGPAGLAAAIALTLAGAGTALVGPRPQPPVDNTPGLPPDGRTAALFPGSMRLLDRLGVGEAIRPDATPIDAIRIVDDRGGLLRAPETVFQARDLALDVLAWNVAIGDLATALAERAGTLKGLTWHAAPAAGLTVAPDRVDVTLADGTRLAGRLVVGADGQNSLVRRAAGIAAETWAYDQAAIVAAFCHARSHRNISTELHHAAGPLTTVPLAGAASSLVWLERADDARRIAGFDDDAFMALLERRLKGLLGSIEAVTPRQAIPMRGLGAARLARPRTVLIGETAHAFPPIGAQGLNLSLRDVATLAEIAGDALAVGRDPGEATVTGRYETARADDVRARTWGVDAINRGLLADLAAFDLVRGAGLHLLTAFGPLRRLAMRAGMHPPSGELPRLMR